MPPRLAASPRRLVASTVWSSRRRILPGTLFTTGHQVCEVLVPVVAAAVVDLGIRTGEPARIALWLGILVVLFLALATFGRLGARFAVSATERTQHDVRMRLVDRILDPVGFRDGARSTGELLTVTGSDAGNLGRSALLGMWPVGQSAAVVVGAVILLGISLPLGLAVLVAGPLLLIAMDRVSRTLRRRTERAQEAVAGTATIAADAVQGHRTLRALGARGVMIGRYRASSRAALAATLSVRRAEAVFEAVARSAGGLFSVGIAIAAGAEALQGRLTPGEVIAVVGIVQVIMGPLEALAVDVGELWSVAVASARRSLEVLRAPGAHPRDGDGARTDAAGAAAPGDPALAIRSLAGEALRGLDLEVRRGELVAVLAGVEAGSELAGILAGRVQPGAGAVELGAEPLAGIPAGERHERIVVAPSRAHDAEGVLPVDLPAAALEAAALEGAGRDPIRSGGERQRLALARALASGDGVLVLRDPTTAVDPVTEARIAGRLRHAVRDRAVLLIAAAPALLAVADRVLWVRDGRIEHVGAHAELLAAHAEYRGALS
ncbi:ABC transporter transmembrane domain-containing protein [Homoserinibacter sp. YIM 151385]|uniref:ABC transporter transmembrane domain-containing protein n=1 Tax=Homoserinibacter sp. YIM 151385 TaxID=2985506 RepID=UPI0022F09F29|nr:ABC transporter ATP-binding protein [Homoserinibacter sp. YIM 151385]WBU37330.1 ABC transporter ATP-binding protein [Homoserinibacter sp. YIM 151385]